MIKNIQRLRNLTTHRLHTEMGHIYEDLENIIGSPGIMTHMIPGIARAIKPWLMENVTDPRFWDGQYDTTHTGEIDLPTPSEEDRQKMLDRYLEQPDPLENKKVIGVIVK